MINKEQIKPELMDGVVVSTTGDAVPFFREPALFRAHGAARRFCLITNHSLRGCKIMVSAQSSRSKPVFSFGLVANATLVPHHCGSRRKPLLQISFDTPASESAVEATPKS